MRSTRNSLITAALLLVIVAAVIAAFSPAFHAQFLNWDDEEHIVAVQEFRGLDAQHLAWMFTTSHMGPYQPLSWLSLAVDHALWGLSPGLDAPEAGRFHATNVVLHALAAIAFFFVARKLLASAFPSASESVRALAAALAALLFAIHPLRVESVAWVTERRDVLSGALFLAAAWAWLRSEPEGRESVVSRRTAWIALACAALAVGVFFLSVELPRAQPLRWSALGAPGLAAALALWIACGVFTARTASFRGGAKWLFLAMLAFLGALLAKGLTLVLPLCLLVLDVWPLRRFQRGARGVLLLEKLPLLALLPIAAALAFWGQASLGHSVVTWEAHPLGDRAAQAGYGFCFYAWRTLWPQDLLPIHELPGRMSFDEPRFFLSALAFVAISVALVAMRRRFPGALAAWAIFVVAVFPVIGFTQAGPQLVADRYSYLACLPFAVLGAGAWLAAREAKPKARAALAAAALAVVLGLGVLTFRQTRRWHDTETLFSHAALVNPSSSMSWRQLATYRSYQANHARDEAERTRRLGEANDFFRRALAATSSPLASLILEYGTNLLLLDRAAEAADMLQRYVAVRPENPMGLTNLGVALGMLDKPREAIACFERAVGVDPRYPLGWLQLASARETLGESQPALAAYERVLLLTPDDPRARAGVERLKGRR